MRIIKTRIGNKILRIKDCRGFNSIRGLMFDSIKDYGGALIYANSVWMPFVKHKLTLLFLDRGFRIIEIQPAVPMTLNPKTWKVYSCSRAKYCLEIKTISGKGLQGKKITFF
ncbi:MAG: DUF192 domain-containing protein [Candidatus Aenigmarchaeota archaeon]|nr:DUF192 domain-containing protein [Candidatus Aenigmarchaeota archaeon]